MNVWVNGIFDIIHNGHIHLFRFAKNFLNKKNKLIVGIDTDKRVKELKGNLRPINSEKDRKEFLESIKYIDKVVIYDTEEEMGKLIQENKIDIMIIGDDYKDKRVVGREFSKKDVFFYKKIEGYSTTNIINKIKKVFCNENNNR